MTTSLSTALVGMNLDGGWTITEPVPRSAAQTGGNFSVGYYAERENHRGYVKILNFAEALNQPDPAVALQRMTASFNFERELLEKCQQNGVSRVIRGLSSGIARDHSRSPSPVQYIIFELAHCDVRAALDAAGGIEFAAKLRLAHQAVAGLSQLHRIQVAHQDVKPSNLLLLEQPTRRVNSKLGDLGRASDRNAQVWHDELNVAGDRRYAPPEQAYGVVADDFVARRVAGDLYQIGSLVAFILTGESLNSHLQLHLNPSFSSMNWGGTYSEALPYLTHAHAAALRDIHGALPRFAADECIALISCLTQPDPSRRGHPGSIRAGQPYSLDRVVTDLDRLTRRAEIEAARLL